MNYFGMDSGGGAEVNTLMTAKALQNKGIKAFIASTGNYEGFQVAKFRPFRLKMLYFQKHYLKNFLQKIIEREGIDLVHSMDRLTCVAAVLAAKKLKKPVVVSFNDHWFICPKSTCVNNEKQLCVDCGFAKVLKCFPLRRVPWELYKLSSIKSALKIIKKASAFTAVGMPLVSKLAKLGINAELVPNFVDLKQFKNAEPEKSIENIKLKKLHFSGRLSYERGVDVLAEIIVELLSKRDDFCFVITGDGPLRQGLEKISKEFPGRVLLLGRLEFSKLARVYKSSDAVLIPAVLDEPFGRVMIEAMACKKPVFASRIGNYKDVITDGVNGFLVSRKDSKEWVEKIIKNFANKERMRKIANNGFRTVEKNFSEKPVIEKLLRVYHSISCSS